MPKQVVLVRMFYNGVWNNITSDVFVDEGIRITRGQGDESAALRPASLALSLNNQGDKYRPSNPMSPLYGAAGRNTQIDVQVGTDYRGVFEISSFSPDRSLVTPTNGRGRAVVDIEAKGLLRRIGQWTDQVQSPLAHYYLTDLPAVAPGVTVSSYVGFEDDPKSTTLYSPVPGTSLIKTDGITFGNRLRPAGSDTIGSLRNGAWVWVGCAPSTDITHGWQITAAVQLPNQPAGAGVATSMLAWSLDDGTGCSASFLAGNLLVFIGSNNIITIDASGTDWTKLQNVVVMSSISAGVVTIGVWWYSTAVGNYLGTQNTYAATETRNIASWQVVAFVQNDGMTIGQVCTTVGQGGILSGNWGVAWNGNPGETASDRFTRICGWLGLTSYVLGSSATTIMGPQLTGATFAEHLQELQATEDALIYDDLFSIGLVFHTRNVRYAIAPTAALLYPADIAPPLVEIIDDQNVHNQVTVSQRDGGEYTATLASGPLSIQAPPNGVNLYRQRVEVSVLSEATQLPALAGWYLSRGTIEGSRFQSLTVDLGRRPDLIFAVAFIDVGDRITLRGLLEYTLDLLVIGSTEQVGSHDRKITFTVIPFTPWDTATYDGTVKRYDVASSTLAGALSSTAISVPVTAPDLNSTWATTDLPYSWLVAGELMTVTAMTAPAGTGPYTQTATVTRSANGIVKAQTSGRPVHIGTPGRLGL
jgi:hypothetical protein